MTISTLERANLKIRPTDDGVPELPDRYLQLKQNIAKELDQKEIERAWSEVLDQLKSLVEESAKLGPEIVPQIKFEDLDKLSEEKIKEIKHRGAVVIRDVVPDEQALQWKEWLREYVTVNELDGFPVEDKQFFQAYWAKSQVQARAHPNVLRVQTWCNQLYHASSRPDSQDFDLATPLSYADRFRLRKPGVFWDAHRPHIDGGGIERWEDDSFRECFKDILSGNWKHHDPYDVIARMDARSSLYARPNQSTVFRTFQGWMALSSTAPGEGTLRVFPSVMLSNAYLILRPFFNYKEDATGDALAKENWIFDSSDPVFPGIWWSQQDNRSFGPRLTDETHPHLQLDKAMVSVPKVEPGDMVFWHCDVVHSVEEEHAGKGDSSVLYIPAVPRTPANENYIKRQLEHFKKGVPPSDFPQDTIPETGNKGIGTLDDLLGEGRVAMGVSVGA